jgi:hypothetical protein
MHTPSKTLKPCSLTTSVNIIKLLCECDRLLENMLTSPRTAFAQNVEVLSIFYR